MFSFWLFILKQTPGAALYNLNLVERNREFGRTKLFNFKLHQDGIHLWFVRPLFSVVPRHLWPCILMSGGEEPSRNLGALQVYWEVCVRLHMWPFPVVYSHPPSPAPGYPPPRRKPDPHLLGYDLYWQVRLGSRSPKDPVTPWNAEFMWGEWWKMCFFTLRWDKYFLIKDKDPFILHCHYQGTVDLEAFLLMWITFNPSMDLIPSKVWDEISYPFPNFNGAAVEVGE